MTTTEWKTVAGYPNYEVSNDGRIKGLKRGRILNPKPDRTGYVLVCLRNDAGMKRLLIHRLVAEAFLPRPEGHDVVHHKDANRANNRVANLEWTTQQKNVKASRRYMRPHSPRQEVPSDTGRLVALSSLPGLEDLTGYAVSDRGFIVSHKGNEPRVLHTFHAGDGYQCVNLQKLGQQTPMKVHRLVAMAFCTGRSPERDVVNHIDHDRANNRYDNLEWCSSSDNRNHGSHVLRVTSSIKEDLALGLGHEALARKHGVNKRTVSRIAKRHGLKRERNLPDSLREAILNDLRNEVNLTEIAIKYAVMLVTVRAIAKAHGVKPRGRNLPSAVKAAAFALLGEGLSQAEVARRLSVDRGTISALVRKLAPQRYVTSHSSYEPRQRVSSLSSQP